MVHASSIRLDQCEWTNWSAEECDYKICGPHSITKTRKKVAKNGTTCEDEKLTEECPLNICSGKHKHDLLGFLSVYEYDFPQLEIHNLIHLIAPK